MRFEAYVCGGRGKDSFSFPENVEAKSIKEALDKALKIVEKYKKADWSKTLPANATIDGIHRTK